MNTYEILEKIKAKAKTDESFLNHLLTTQNSKQPYYDFCKICQENGFEISAMDLVNIGEEYYAAMRRSTNGGGENSPMLEGQDDYYEMLLLELKGMKKKSTNAT